MSSGCSWTHELSLPITYLVCRYALVNYCTIYGVIYTGWGGGCKHLGALPRLIHSLLQAEDWTSKGRSPCLPCLPNPRGRGTPPGQARGPAHRRELKAEWSVKTVPKGAIRRGAACRALPGRVTPGLLPTRPGR